MLKSQKVSPLSILSVLHIGNRTLEFGFRIEKADAPSFRPPVFTSGIELFSQASSRPSFEIHSNFLGAGECSCDDNMQMIYSAVHRMEMPVSMLTRLGNL